MSTPRVIRSKNVRVGIALACGIIAALGSGIFWGWQYAPLIGWDILAGVLLFLLWLDLKGHSPSETATVARRDDMNHNILDILLTIASIASLGGVISLINGSGQSDTSVQLGHAALGLISVIISWATIHSLYTVRYADMYYADADRCIDFGETKTPTFSDFAYLAFTIGMTYQVSDTTLKTSKIRKVALHHALLSFLFGTAIIATTINTVASLGK